MESNRANVNPSNGSIQYRVRFCPAPYQTPFPLSLARMSLTKLLPVSYKVSGLNKLLRSNDYNIGINQNQQKSIHPLDGIRIAQRLKMLVALKLLACPSSISGTRQWKILSSFEEGCSGEESA